MFTAFAVLFVALVILALVKAVVVTVAGVSKWAWDNAGGLVFWMVITMAGFCYFTLT